MLVQVSTKPQNQIVALCSKPYFLTTLFIISFNISVYLSFTIIIIAFWLLFVNTFLIFSTRNCIYYERKNYYNITYHKNHNSLPLFQTWRLPSTRETSTYLDVSSTHLHSLGVTSLVPFYNYNTTPCRRCQHLFK